MNVLFTVSLAVIVFFPLLILFFIKISGNKYISPDQLEYINVLTSDWQTTSDIRAKMEKLKNGKILMVSVIMSMNELWDKNLIDYKKVPLTNVVGFEYYYRRLSS